MVQGSESTQEVLLRQQLAMGLWVHDPPLQPSVVQTSPSSQSAARLQQPGARSWTQKPLGAPTQVSVVQLFPSLQSPATAQQPAPGWEQVPPTPEQRSSVHRFASRQS